MKWKTPWNAQTFPPDHEVNDLPSKTIPDQTMSIGEIMRRYASGLPVGGARVPMYESEEDMSDMPDLSRMDRADQEFHKEQIAHEIANLQQRAKDAQAYSKAQKKESRERSAKEQKDAAPPVHPKKLPAEGAAGGNEA